MRQRYETQDIVQEVLARAISNVDDFENRGKGALWAWRRGLTNHVPRAAWRPNARLPPAVVHPDAPKSAVNIPPG